MAQIAIDGPAGVGKSTAAKRVAARLGFVYIDTGAMYRALGLFAHQNGVDLADGAAVVLALGAAGLEIRRVNGEQRVFVGGEDVTEAIRLPEVGMYASAVAKHGAVRERLVAVQQALAEGLDVVMDGRDIGAVVLPNADLKVYLTADINKLAERRCQELAQKGLPFDPQEVARDIAARVRQDKEREQSPDKPCEGAAVIDTGALTAEEVEAKIVRLFARRHCG